MRNLLFLLLIVSAPGIAQTTTAFSGATIYPVSGEPFFNGVMVVRDGKIVSTGTANEISIPKDAEIIDVSGKVIIPGLVDTHSHIGEGDGGDRSSPTQPEVRILDAIDPQSDTFKKALAGGITTVNVMPGSGHLMSGQTVYLKMRKGKIINDLLFCEDIEKDICGGMKMANGTNPLSSAPFPGTRSKSAAIIRQLFVKAEEYQNKMEAEEEEKRPARDLEMEALLQVLDGSRIVHHHTHRADDIITAIRLATEFGFRMVLHHVSDGWKVADEIAASGIPCSIIVLDSPGGKKEALGINFKTGATLERAGVDVAFHTDDYITDSRLFIRSAALGVRGGMSREKALEALTLAGARMLDLDHRIGSLEKGKDADFVILSGDPFSIYSRVEQTWVEGIKVFDLANPDDHKIAVGGFEVFRGDFQTIHHCGGEE